MTCQRSEMRHRALTIDSIVFATAMVSGTFSSSTILRPGIFLRVAAAIACDWFQPKSRREPT